MLTTDSLNPNIEDPIVDIKEDTQHNILDELAEVKALLKDTRTLEIQKESNAAILKMVDFVEGIYSGTNQLLKDRVQKNETSIEHLLLCLRNDILEGDKEEFKNDKEIILGVSKVKSVVDKLDSKYNKTLAVKFTLFLLLGMGIGALLTATVEAWLPYLANALDFTKTISNIIR